MSANSSVVNRIETIADNRYLAQLAPVANIAAENRSTSDYAAAILVILFFKRLSAREQLADEPFAAPELGDRTRGGTRRVTHHSRRHPASAAAYWAVARLTDEPFRIVDIIV